MQPIPQKMQAILLEKEGGPLMARQIPVPQPGPRQVLVKMSASVINPSDIGFLLGSSEYVRPLPAIPGTEGSGRVVAAGPGTLSKFLVGKRVACAKSSSGSGTWAEYMLTSATSCIPLSKETSMEQGATLVVNPMTALAFMQMIKKGRHKAVVNTAAASQLGRMLVRLCVKDGIDLINIVRREQQAEMLRGMGAKHVLVSDALGFDVELKELAHRLGAQLFLEAVGGDFTQRLIDASPDGSMILLYANLSRQPARIIPNSLWHHDRRLEGFYLPVWTKKQGMYKILTTAGKAQRLAAGDLATVFQKRLHFTQAQEALELYRSDMTAGKVLLVME